MSTGLVATRLPASVLVGSSEPNSRVQIARTALFQMCNALLSGHGHTKPRVSYSRFLGGFWQCALDASHMIIPCLKFSRIRPIAHQVLMVQTPPGNICAYPLVMARMSTGRVATGLPHLSFHESSEPNLLVLSVRVGLFKFTTLLSLA
jgi:hypothetical protein